MSKNKEANQDSSIPQSLLTRVFDASGSIEEGTRGFLIFYVNESGIPSVYSKTSNACVDMALHKLVELYINQPTNQTPQ